MGEPKSIHLKLTEKLTDSFMHLPLATIGCCAPIPSTNYVNVSVEMDWREMEAESAHLVYGRNVFQ